MDIIKLMLLKCTIQWVLVYLQIYAPFTIINFISFFCLKKKSQTPLAIPTIHIHTLFSHKQPLLCFLFLWVYLFWVFGVDGIISYVTLCVWLLSLGIRFSRFIHRVAPMCLPYLYSITLRVCLSSPPDPAFWPWAPKGWNDF